MSTTTTISTSADSATRGRATRPRAALRLVASTAAAVQLPFPFEYDVTPGVPAVPPVPTNLRVVGSPDEAAGAGELLDPRLWMARLARACAEVAIGARPPMQLKQHVAGPELARLARRGMAFQSHPASRNQRGVSRLLRVRAVRICPVAPGIIEASAVLVGGERAQAVAIRLEATEGRWLATAVELG